MNLRKYFSQFFSATGRPMMCVGPSGLRGLHDKSFGTITSSVMPQTQAERKSRLQDWKPKPN